MSRPLTVLVVDDEAPAVAVLRWMLESEPCAGEVHKAASAQQALRVLAEHRIDVILLDIHMPGPSGLELARHLHDGPGGSAGAAAGSAGAAARSNGAPQIIFVTADAEPAVEAFELEARDYLLKPVRQERLRAALLKVAAATTTPEAGAGTQAGAGSGAEDGAGSGAVAGSGAEAGSQGSTGTDAGASAETGRVAVLQGDSTLLIPIPAIRWAQAHGDYVRLHTADDSALLRITLAELEQQWADYGFVRIHRSHSVNLNHVRRILHRHGRMSVQIGDEELAVARRTVPQVRARLEELTLRARPHRDPGRDADA